MIWTNKRYLREWHRWFAWYPVQVGDGTTTAWLMTVERKFWGDTHGYRLPQEEERRSEGG